MTDLHIRDMTGGDIDPAVALYRSGGWEERRSFLETVMANPSCRPLVGTRDGLLVATGMATVNGPVGWVGSIFVDANLRRQGYGRAMTDAVCDVLDSAGCTTQALIASEYGKPVYERMGFRIDGWYQILEAAPLNAAPVPPRGTSLRPMRPEDVDRVGALDCRATGEDRRGLLGPLGGGGWVLETGHTMLGFLIQILPDSAAIVAPDPEDGACLLSLLRHLGKGRARTLHAAVVKGNEEGRSSWSGAAGAQRLPPRGCFAASPSSGIQRTSGACSASLSGEHGGR
jgi:GNAT superfamily N-acetyltransferase